MGKRPVFSVGRCIIQATLMRWRTLCAATGGAGFDCLYRRGLFRQRGGGLAAAQNGDGADRERDPALAALGGSGLRRADGGPGLRTGPGLAGEAAGSGPVLSGALPDLLRLAGKGLEKLDLVLLRLLRLRGPGSGGLRPASDPGLHPGRPGLLPAFGTAAGAAGGGGLGPLPSAWTASPGTGAGNWCGWV